MKKYKSARLRINKSVYNFEEGQIISIALDEFGNPVDHFWSRLLKEAEEKDDNSVEILKIQSPVSLGAMKM